MISIIIPTLGDGELLDTIRLQIAKSQIVCEVLICIPRPNSARLAIHHPSERIIQTEKKGRGHQIYAGTREAVGRFLLLLHDDTILPNGWDIILQQMIEKEEIVGGGFKLRFDQPSFRYRALAAFADPYYKLTGEIWGDRALFVRRKSIQDELSILDVPLMEDVILSKWMQKNGRVVLIQDPIITSTKRFRGQGFWRHIGRILFCRFLFSLGISPDRIYRIYYSG